MGKYTVCVETTMHSDFEVEAENGEDAEDQVKAMFEDGRAIWPHDVIEGNTRWELQVEAEDNFWVEEADS